VILRADFGWVILAAFVLWILQVLKAGATGKGKRGEGGLPPGPPSGNPGGTQREGVELEQLLLQLERRLGQAGERAGQRRAKVIVKRPAPEQPEPVTVRREPLVRREPVVQAIPEAAPEEASLEGDVNIATEKVALPRRPPAHVVARPSPDLSARRAAVAPSVTSRQLRNAVLWREILGPPKGLQ
jgi:hypothetical protein